jgi:hypothetical protein
MVMYVASVNELFNSVIVNERDSVKGKQVQHVCMSRGGGHGLAKGQAVRSHSTRLLLRQFRGGVWMRRCGHVQFLVQKFIAGWGLH